MTPEQAQQAIEHLDPYSTAQLVEALKQRDGVEWCLVAPDEHCEIAVRNTPTIVAPRVTYKEGRLHEEDSGPMLILKVVD